MGLAAVQALSAPGTDTESLAQHLRSQHLQAQQPQQPQPDGSDAATDAAEYSAFAFWRAPIQPPELMPEPVPESARTQESVSAPEAPSSTRLSRCELVSQPEPSPAHPSLNSARDQQTEPSLQERLAAFERGWMKTHGRALTPADARGLPEEVLAMYREHTASLRLSPEAMATALAAAEAKEATRLAVEEQREEEARAKAEALERERARRWAEFESAQGEAWKQARAEVWDARVEAVGREQARQLSGAASWVKAEERQSAEMTREAYVQKMREKLGMPAAAQPAADEM